MSQERVGYPPIITPGSNGHHYDAGAEDAVKRAIRYNAETDSTWKYHELAKTLYKFGDIFASDLIDPVARIGVKPMPSPIIGFDQDDVRTNAYYRLRENPIGINDEVIFNEKRIDRPLYGILETLCHEMTHLWQQRRGENPVKNALNTHNKEFCDKMEQMGLHPTPVVGCHYKPADGNFEALVTRHGIAKPEQKEILVKGIKIDYWDIEKGKPKGRSTLTAWDCPECGFTVRIGKKLEDEESPVACPVCTRKKYGDVPMVTFVRRKP